MKLIPQLASYATSFLLTLASCNAFADILLIEKPVPLPPTPVATTMQPLSGKLFFTSDERAKLERARKTGIVETNPEPSDETEPTADAPPKKSIINGFVKRTDGSTVVWIDGVPRTLDRTQRTSPLAASMVGNASRVELKSAADSPINVGITKK